MQPAGTHSGLLRLAWARALAGALALPLLLLPAGTHRGFLRLTWARALAGALPLPLLLLLLLLLLLPMVAVSHSAGSDPPSSPQQEALLAIYNGTAGADWLPHCQAGWANASTVHFCDWAGVVCDLNRTAVVLLNISGCDARGWLPSQAIAQLATLRLLAAANNTLTGPLPSTLAELPYLTLLDLSRNQFSGSVPAALLARLPELQVLLLSYNNLAGPLFDSDDFQVHPNTSLQLFAANRNAFTGTLPPVLGQLSQLQILILAGNHFHGPLPAALRLLNATLQHLDISRAQLSGSLDALRALTALRRLALQGNDLQGVLPTWLLQLRNLSELRLDRNHFSCQLPSFTEDSFQQACDDTFGDGGGGEPELSASAPRTSSCQPYVSLLQGNKFDCTIPGPVRRFDSYGNHYVCPDESLRRMALITAASAAAAMCTLLACWFSYRCRKCQQQHHPSEPDQAASSATVPMPSSPSTSINNTGAGTERKLKLTRHKQQVHTNLTDNPQHPTFLLVLNDAYGRKNQRGYLKLVFTATCGVALLYAAVLLPLYASSASQLSCPGYLRYTLAYKLHDKSWPYILSATAGFVVPLLSFGLLAFRGFPHGLIGTGVPRQRQSPLSSSTAQRAKWLVVLNFLLRRLVAASVVIIAFAVQTSVNVGFLQMQSLLALPGSWKWTAPVAFAIAQVTVSRLLARPVLAGIRWSVGRDRIRLRAMYHVMTLLMVFNSLLAPLLSTLLFDASCFFYALYPEPTEHALLPLAYCSLTLDGHCVRYSSRFVTVDIAPKFTVDQSDCLATLVTNYTPAYVFALGLHSFILPLCEHVLVPLARRFWPLCRRRLNYFFKAQTEVRLSETESLLQQEIDDFRGGSESLQWRSMRRHRAAAAERDEADGVDPSSAATGAQVPVSTLDVVAENINGLYYLAVAMTFGFTSPLVAGTAMLSFACKLYMDPWWTMATKQICQAPQGDGGDFEKQYRPFRAVPMGCLLIVLVGHLGFLVPFVWLENEHVGQLAVLILLEFLCLAASLWIYHRYARARRSIYYVNEEVAPLSEADVPMAQGLL